MNLCAVDECGTRAGKSGWCAKHYVRWQKHGDVNADYRRVRETPAERFWRQVQKTESCWEWLGTRNVSGYGKFWLDGRTVRPHRWSYEQEVGPIPEGLQIDHLCRNRACVRPDHLEAVTGKVNSSRGKNGRATHCKQGHEYTPENTYVMPPRPDLPHGGRACRICRAKTSAEWNAAVAAGYTPARPRPPRTHCKNGHELTPENTYVKPNGYQRCRECTRQAERAYLARKSGGVR